MGIRRCVNCMAALGAEEKSCHICGFDNQNDNQPEYALNYYTILHGRYMVGNVIGKGGFAITYIGFDILLDMKVAIKEYFPNQIASRNRHNSDKIFWTSLGGQGEWEQSGEQFLREARKMAQIDSVPGIVRVRDTFKENGTSYIIMDFIEGETLKAKLIREGTMTYEVCLKIFLPLLKGVDEFHRKGVIHRDISPDNIMIQPNGEAKLLDFGAAKDITIKKNGKVMPVTKRGFSPPEQYAEQGNVGAWTDVYSLCATIFYCLFGKILPVGLERMVNDTLVLEPDEKRGVTQEVAAILKEGLALRYEVRIRTVGELMRRLEDAANTVSPESRPKPARKPLTKAAKISIGAAAALAVLFAGILMIPKSESVELPASIAYYHECDNLPRPDTCVDDISYEGQNVTGYLYNIAGNQKEAQERLEEYIAILQELGFEVGSFEESQSRRFFECQNQNMRLLSDVNETVIRKDSKTLALIGYGEKEKYAYMMYVVMDSGSADEFYGQLRYLEDINEDFVSLDGCALGITYSKEDSDETFYSYLLSNSENGEENEGKLECYLGVLELCGFQIQKIAETQDSRLFQVSDDSERIAYLVSQNKELQILTEEWAKKIIDELEPEPEPEPEPKSEPKQQSKQQSEYIIPNSNSVLLKASDVAGLSLREINYAKNEIYARHGRKFNSPELQNYFNSKSWYKGTISPEAFGEGILSDIERKNADLLSQIEFGRDPNGYQLDAN